MSSVSFFPNEINFVKNHNIAPIYDSYWEIIPWKKLVLSYKYCKNAKYHNRNECCVKRNTTIELSFEWKELNLFYAHLTIARWAPNVPNIHRLPKTWDTGAREHCPPGKKNGWVRGN